jgi:hypothetical protein
MTRLRSDPRVKDLQVAEYHVVMPWDRTLEVRTLVDKHAASCGLPPPVWDGLTQMNAWAAAYPQCVDYWLDGFRDAVRNEAMALIRGLRLGPYDAAEIAGMSVDTFAKEASAALRDLSARDPFYAYAVELSPQPLAAGGQSWTPPQRPNLVQSFFHGDANGHVRIDVIAKTALSTTLAPITITFNLKPQSEADAALLRNFARFGSPLHLPSGVESLTVDAPAGLGLEVGETFKSGGQIWTAPRSDRIGDDDHLRLAVFDDSDQEICAVDVTRVYATSGLAGADGNLPGIEARFEDPTKQLCLIVRTDFVEQIHELNVEFNPPIGQIAVDVLPALQVASELRAPNKLGIGKRFGKLLPWFDLPDEPMARRASQWKALVKAITQLQSQTDTVLRVPDPTDPDIDLQAIQSTARILAGETLPMPASSMRSRHIEGLQKGDFIPTSTAITLTVELSGATIEVRAAALCQARPIKTEETADGLVDVWEIEDESVEVRLPTDEELAADPDH